MAVSMIAVITVPVVFSVTMAIAAVTVIVVSVGVAVVIVVMSVGVSVMPAVVVILPAVAIVPVAVVSPGAAIRVVEVAAAAGRVEAVRTPAVAVSPVCPGSDSEKDSVIEVARAVEAHRCTGVRGVVVISVGADGRWSADLDVERNLRAGLGCGGQEWKNDSGTEQRQGGSAEGGFGLLHSVHIVDSTLFRVNCCVKSISY